ncbi:MAG: exo-alpha-sialidase [Ardenticatenaceae bacterium]|nr:exo-alpha-sialidase [Ardenticatenaceae bacterium]
MGKKDNAFPVLIIFFFVVVVGSVILFSRSPDENSLTNTPIATEIPSPSAVPTHTLTPSTTPAPTYTFTPNPTSTHTPTATATSTPTPVNFHQPIITQAITGFDLPGYSKQASIVRDSDGKMTLFVRNSAGDLGYIESSDNGQTWNEPVLFDHISPPGGPQVAAAVDSEDRIHIIWGRGPESSDANYGLLANSALIVTSTVGTGTFARDIAVDSANHPHIVWTNVDLFHTVFNGQEWISAESIVRGA